MAKYFATDAADFDSTATIVGARAEPTGLAAALKALSRRLMRSRNERVDSEIGRFLAAHGGQLTDDLERQISRKFGGHPGQW